jgi:hypothetical protein
MNIEAIGGRKFVLAVLTLVALVALAAADSSILTTEVIVAILGVLATYSGSNSFLTAMATKATPQSAAAPQATEELGGEIQYVDSKANEAASKIERVEKDLGELIQIVAQLQEVVLTRLPSADTITEKVGTDDNARREQAAQNRKALSAGI